jgi:hypothetical protein
VEYLKPARLDDRLDVVAGIESLGRAQVVFAQRIERNGEPLVTASVRVACLDLKRNRATAIPEEPFTRRFGSLLGRTSGSFRVSSKFGPKGTVSLSRSSRSSPAAFVSLTSVYRIAAAASPSMDPKFPWPSTRGVR